MSESCVARSEELQIYTHGMAVPAARPIGDFQVERVGNDAILFDAAVLQYHTLNDFAFRVWRLCDGRASVEAIAAELEQSGSEAHVEAVELAIVQLCEAGLMQASVQSNDVRLQRRKVLKLAAAGAIAAVSVPVVGSITAPEASAQNTGRICPDGKKCPVNKCCCCHPADQGGGYDNCDCSCDVAGEDCSTPGLAKTCVC